MMAMGLAASTLVQATDPVLCEDTHEKCQYKVWYESCENPWSRTTCPGTCEIMCNEDGSFVSACEAKWPCPPTATCIDGEGDDDYTCTCDVDGGCEWNLEVANDWWGRKWSHSYSDYRCRWMYYGKLATLTEDQAKRLLSAEDEDDLFWVGLKRIDGGWIFKDNDTYLNAEEFAALPEHMTYEPAHYGLYPDGGTWEWSDGQTFTLDNLPEWLAGFEPKWGECGALKGTGEITAINCRREHKFICQFA